MLEDASLLVMDSDLEVLKDLDEEYHSLSGSISRQISSLKDCDAKKCSTIIDTIKSEMEQCKDCVNNMKGELQGLTDNQRQQWRNRIERYESDFKTLKRDFDREKNNAQRKELFAGAKDNINLTHTAEQARLINTVQTEKDNTSMLKDSAKQLRDTETQAIEIEENLYDHRGKITNIHNNLKQGNTLLGRMSRMVRRMNRREALMKVLWCFIIFLIIGVIALVVYLSVKK